MVRLGPSDGGEIINLPKKGVKLKRYVGILHRKFLLYGYWKAGIASVSPHSSNHTAPEEHLWKGKPNKFKFVISWGTNLTKFSLISTKEK